MSGGSLKLFALALTFVTVTTASTAQDEGTLSKISNYREWSRVTQRALQKDISSLAG